MTLRDEWEDLSDDELRIRLDRLGIYTPGVLDRLVAHRDDERVWPSISEALGR